MSSATVKQEEIVRRLRVIAGPDQDKVFELPVSGAVSIGRAPETLTQFRDLTVSRNHCRLEVNGGRVLVLNSSKSGTLVNDRLVTEHELHHDDVIRLGEDGETKIRFEVEDVFNQATVRGGKQMREAMADEQKDLVGKALGHFRIDSVLAEGAAGNLFLARDTRRNRDVALKVFVFNKSLPQLIRMLQPLVGLQHPNLVELYEAGETQALFWVAQERVDGESLEKQFQQTRALDWQEALRQGSELAQGLEMLHRRGVVHRIVAPPTVLVARADRRTKLGGLWHARAVQDCRADAADMQDVLRHVAYMPPERLRGGQSATTRGDVYGLGAVLYHLLTGHPPFTGSTDQEIIARSVQTDPVPPRALVPALPEPLEQIVLRMLAKQPEQRYENAQEVLAALQTPDGNGVSVARATHHGAVSYPASGTHQGAGQAAHAALLPITPPAAALLPIQHGVLVPPPPPPVPAPAAKEGKIRVACGACGQVLNARKQFAGTKVRCPACKEFIALPGRASVTETDQPVTEQSLVSLRHHRGPAPAWKAQAPPAGGGSALSTGGRYLLLVALLLLTLALSLSGLVCDDRKPRVPSEKGAQDAAKNAPAEKQPAKGPK